MKWFIGILSLMLMAVFTASDSEAGRHNRSWHSSRTKVTSHSNCSSGACSTIQSQSACVCDSSACVCDSSDVYNSRGSSREKSRESYSIQGSDLDIQAWAIDEANRMADLGTNGHTKPAPVGYFVGVGCNGMTCSRPGMPEADVTIRGKTVRVWRN